MKSIHVYLSMTLSQGNTMKELKKLRQQMKELQRSQQQGAVERWGTSSSSSTPSFPAQSPIVAQLTAISVHLSRAESALQAAQSVAQAASQSFAQEQANVAQARRELESVARTMQ
jgi:hypothetical protein